jgi:hypothetical protein
LIVETITWKTKRKAKKHIAHMNQRGRELVPLVMGNYRIHNPSNVIFMQIMRSNSNRSFITSISHQCNLPFYSKG